MLRLRKSSERGRTRLDWLDSRHSFSFGEYYDPIHTGFGPLRVINDDRIAPGGGFPLHGHRDMEILTYVLDGTLEHQDSLGNGALIRAGEVQRMSAGAGIRHSEYNPSPAEPVRLLQIWIEPRFRGLPPGYAQRAFSTTEKHGRLLKIAAPDGADGALKIHQDAHVYAGILAAGAGLDVPLAPGRRAYLHLARGRLRVNGEDLAEGDGLAAENADRLLLSAPEEAEMLLFDLP